MTYRLNAKRQQQRRQEGPCAPSDGLGTEPGCRLANLAVLLLPLFPWVLTHFLNLEV